MIRRGRRTRSDVQARPEGRGTTATMNARIASPMWRLVALVVLTVASAVLLAGASSLASASGSASRCTWRKAYELPRAVFEDVAVSPEGAVWAVGWKGMRKAFPVITRWDGTSWDTEIGDVRGKHLQVHAR